MRQYLLPKSVTLTTFVRKTGKKVLSRWPTTTSRNLPMRHSYCQFRPRPNFWRAAALSLVAATIVIATAVQAPESIGYKPAAAQVQDDPGSLDTSFGDSGKVTTSIGIGSDHVRGLAVQSDGKIVVAGYSHNGTDLDFALARYDADGSLDVSFGDDGKVTTSIGTREDHTHGMAIQPDGKIVVVGHTHSENDLDFAVVRYDADGSLDTSFGDGGMVTTSFGPGWDYGQAVTVQPDGKIVVIGHTYNDNEQDFAVARYNADGSLDTSFGDGGKATTSIGTGWDYGQAVTVQPDGKIVVVGHTYSENDQDFAVVRYDTDGSLDTSFDDDGKVITSIGQGEDRGNAVVVQQDGKILVAGHSHNGTDLDFAVVRYDTDGSLDTSFGDDGKVVTSISPGWDYGQAVTVQPDGKIVVIGYSHNGTDFDFAVARYDAGGSLDTSFGNDGKVTTPIGPGEDRGYAVALQRDGNILVAGHSYNGTDFDFAMVRYHGHGFHQYDLNRNGSIDRDEAVQAVLDYQRGQITRAEAVQIILLYHGG